MKKFLLIHNIQTKEQWHNDSINIANSAYKAIDYKLPNKIYVNNFIKLLTNFIEYKAISLYDIEDIKDMLYKLSQESFNESLQNGENIEGFDFDDSNEEIIKLSSIISYGISEYYKNKEIVKSLKAISPDTIFVYSSTFCKNMLSQFYKHKNPIFKATTDNYNITIDELKVIYGRDIKIISLS